MLLDNIETVVDYGPYMCMYFLRCCYCVIFCVFLPWSV